MREYDEGEGGVIAMKKLSEVCKITGVTRRTLQEYDKIGLLKPTIKSEAGYWYYDDVAIEKLMLIRIFVEVGYERKTIKNILESPNTILIVEFDKIIDVLMEKRKRIDGTINTIKILTKTLTLPQDTLTSMSNLEIMEYYREKNFALCLEDTINYFTECDEDGKAQAELPLPFLYNIIAIGCLNGFPVDSPRVQTVVEHAYDELINLVSDVEDIQGLDITTTEFLEDFAQCIYSMLKDPRFLKKIKLPWTDSEIAYINQAVRIFCDKKQEL